MYTTRPKPSPFRNHQQTSHHAIAMNRHLKLWLRARSCRNSGMTIIRQIELKNIEHEVAGIGKACSNWIVYSRISASCYADHISLAGAAVGDGFDSVLHSVVLGTGSLWPHCGVAGGRWWSRWWRWWRARQSCRLLRQLSLLGIVLGFVSCHPSVVVCFRVRVHSPGWNHQSCHQDRPTQHGAESEVGHLHNLMSPTSINTLKQQQESWLPATKLRCQIPVHAPGCPRIVWWSGVINLPAKLPVKRELQIVMSVPAAGTPLYEMPPGPVEIWTRKSPMNSTYTSLKEVPVRTKVQEWPLEYCCSRNWSSGEQG